MPVWDYTLDVKDIWKQAEDDTELNLEMRDEIVRRIRASKFYSDDNIVLAPIVIDLADAEDFDDFNEAWHQFYNYADYYRIWVATF